ncbi:sensor histidine kinase [Mesobacillus subterraneus]|uniref:histidine kinase n=1 Tax=Mesobacillus subterraneus TaxID=285983 RepID=A0A427TNJ3_9BACI|nr:sensor histidine kinase [Mesobacillus subterraneus]RSD25886.1 sensor histidine kinase [Mesobacillus subterraneus]
MTDKEILFRKKISNYYIILIGMIGWGFIFYSIPYATFTEKPIVLLLLMILMLLSEYFQIPLFSIRMFSTMTFPILFVMNAYFGIHTALVVFAFVLIFESFHHKRSLPSTIFNIAQYTISLVGADWLIKIGLSNYSLAFPYENVLIIFSFTALYFFINNVTNDLLFYIRPLPFTTGEWKDKALQEWVIATMSIILLVFLDTYTSYLPENIIDFTIILFLSIWIVITMTISILTKARIEKKRLNALSILSTELNRNNTNDLNEKKNLLADTFNANAFVLLAKENHSWKLLLKDGQVNSEVAWSDDMELYLEEIPEMTIVTGKDLEKLPSNTIFNKMILSQIFSPLIMDNEKVGMLIVGRVSAIGFSFDEIRSLTVLSNVLASTLKTRSLLLENEKLLIVEERSRIARDIHDGIGQSLAGIVFKMESSLRRKNENKGDILNHQIEQWIEQLRESLKELRQSIYSLRTCPVEQYGLKRAIQEKIRKTEEEGIAKITFSQKGEPYALGYQIEKVIYDIFRESLQNSVKHAKAKKIDVMLKYGREQTMIKIKDDGIGFSLYDKLISGQSEPHFGILTMNELAHKFGAKLEIDSAEGKGTEIRLGIRHFSKEEKA